MPGFFRHKKEKQTFKGQLATFGYVYKFYIIAGGQELVFEKDEESEYQAFAADEKKGKDINPGGVIFNG